jgi:hypothetical protein
MTDNALYLEADEDITSAIDKLTKSPGQKVQIVVPKRSTMLQSIINLKLMKKAAEGSGKELILVTNDKIATDLAGRVGLAVAPSIGANPVVQSAEMPEDLKSNEEIIEASDPEPPAAPEPVAPKSKSIPTRPFIKHREIQDEPPEPKAAVSESSDDKAAATTPKKPLKVPNWSRLQRRVMWVAGAVVLVIGYFAFMYFGSSATVTLYANGTKTDISSSFTVDPTLKQTDFAKGVLAGQLVSVNKTLSGTFTPTGKEDAGTKAGGTVTIQNCSDTNTYTLNAGNTLTSQGLSFITQQNVTIPGGTFSIQNGQITGCTSPTVSDPVTAAQNGDNYNLTNASFSSSKLNSKFNITGSMTGGTTKTITVVTQNDVDTAEAAILAGDKNNATSALGGRVPTGFTALTASQSSTVSSVSPAPAVGAQGSSATLSLSVTYSELAVSKSDYRKLIDNQELSQVGSGNQVYDDGFSSANVSQSSTDPTGRAVFAYTTTAYSGAKLNTASLAKQLSGMRFSDATDFATGLPGISQANISNWPSWSTSLPSRPGSIHIKIQVLNK